MDLKKVNEAEALLRERSNLKRSMEIFKKEGESDHLVVGNLHVDAFGGFRGTKEMHAECKSVVEKHLKKALEDIEKDIKEL